MDLRVVGVLLLIPLLDVMVLVILATQIGAAATVALVVLTALLGLLLVRAEGRHTIRKIQRRVARGEVPTSELLDGALLLVAGAFLLTPGIVTDALGILLVLPPTRYPFRLALERYVVEPYVDAKTGGFVTGDVYPGGFPDREVELDEEEYRFGEGGATDREEGEGPDRSRSPSED